MKKLRSMKVEVSPSARYRWKAIEQEQESCGGCRIAIKSLLARLNSLLNNFCSNETMLIHILQLLNIRAL